MFVNPIMRKLAPLIIFKWIQFTERTVAVETTIRHEALLAKQNGEVMAKMSLLSLSGAFLSKQRLWSTGRGVVLHPDRVLVKTSTDNSRWQTERCSDDRNSRSLYTSKVI